MASVEETIASFERNIAAETGVGIEAWVDRLRAKGFARHGEMVAWLKSEHGLGHGYANHLAKRALAVPAAAAGDDGVGHLFAGSKAGLRPLYDALAAAAQSLGPDVELAPKKANVSVRRRKQFALLQPGAGRIDLGLILKDTPPAGRLEAAGSFNAMFTHRVRVASAGEIDAELRGWLTSAYGAAG